LLAAVLVMAAAVLLPRLGAPTVQEWDEARHAQNALEILSGGDWIVLRHRGEPDLWNLRPPLWAWVIAVSFALFGASELALRVGSALAGAGTAVLLCAWGAKRWGPAVGLAAAALLLSMKGFVIDHGARTGNCDVMVSFFVTLALYRFWQTQQKGDAEIPPGTAVAVALGVLVKGVIGLVPVPVIGLTLALRERRLGRVFRARRTWVGAALLVGLVAPWAVARALAGSDFFVRMVLDDVLRRVSEPIEGHGGDALFYVHALKSGLGTSLFVAFVAVLAGRVWRLREADWTERLLLVWIVLVVVAFTVARTKLVWYLMPAYPAIALFVAGQAERWRLQMGWSVGRMAVVLALLAAPAFGSVVSKIRAPLVDPCAHAIRGSASVLKGHPAVYIFEGEATQSRFFYLSAGGPERVRALSSLESQISPKGSIVTCDPAIRERLERTDRFEQAHRVGELTIFRDRRSP
jgi:4-amino-4-deoxy-L-arabinose transferase-like glycosyltransferase